MEVASRFYFFVCLFLSFVLFYVVAIFNNIKTFLRKILALNACQEITFLETERKVHDEYDVQVSLRSWEHSVPPCWVYFGPDFGA